MSTPQRTPRPRAFAARSWVVRAVAPLPLATALLSAPGCTESAATKEPPPRDAPPATMTATTAATPASAPTVPTAPTAPQPPPVPKDLPPPPT